jgi:hypothetical protein
MDNELTVQEISQLTEFIKLFSELLREPCGAGCEGET